MRPIFKVLLSLTLVSAAASAATPPAPLRIATFNTKAGTGESLATFRDHYLSSEPVHVLCLQEIPPARWDAIHAQFPLLPHRLQTVKRSTAPFTRKSESLAILSSLPILESDAVVIQIDPAVDKWERWAQYAKLDLGAGRSVRVFHFHNTYNFNADDFASERAGLQKFRDWIRLKTGAPLLAAVPDLIVLGDFNLLSEADVQTYLDGIPLIKSDGRDYLLATPAARSATTLKTAPTISDHNALTATIDLPVAVPSAPFINQK